MSNDFRKQWFCDRILTYLSERDSKLLNRLLNLDETRGENEFDIFLNADSVESDDDICKRVFIVYKSSYKTVIEEEEEEVILDEACKKSPHLF